MVLHVGAFDLVEPLSKGGMGTVWSAVHRASERTVAIKVMSTRGSDPIYADSFDREVRAVAKLNHPHIVGVFDFGRIPFEIAERSAGKLRMNSPWFAMEIADCGSLAQIPRVQNWNTLRSILCDILDGLAHAHARDVIHRDIKPGNVLLSRTSEGIVAKLTDFGIAHLSHGQVSTHEVFASAAGTPWYMAPEQIDSRWRDYGPWTDLYAVGCLSYRLATGKTPFDSSSPIEVARQHLYEEPPPFEPEFEVPAGMREWVAKLMFKNYAYRFRRAAEAAWTLRQIDPSPIARLQWAHESKEQVEEASTIDVNDETLLHDTTASRKMSTLTQKPPRKIETINVAPLMPLQVTVPPIPKTWAYHNEPDLVSLSGAGLKLFGLRELPFVGRMDQRDTCWEVFRNVATERRSQGILLTGNAGVGKTRIAEWIAQRAHELGAASVVIGRHYARSDKPDDLQAMFTRLLQCRGLDVDRAYQRVLQMLPAHARSTPEEMAFSAAAIAHLMFPGDRPKAAPKLPVVSTRERYSWANSVLRNLSNRRPVIVILDDVQWAHGAAEFMEHALNQADEVDAPILFIATCRSQIPPRRVLATRAVGRLKSHERITHIELEDMTASEFGELLSRSLMLSPKTVEFVEARSPTNPLLITQLFGDWVERDALVATEAGFALSSDPVSGHGGEIGVPTDLEQAWIIRLKNVISKVEGDAMFSLQIAACLGGAVSNKEWYGVARMLNIDIPDALVERLQTAGLIQTADKGWWFRHEQLREALETYAERHDLIVQIHESIAGYLNDRSDLESLLRRTGHIADSGRYRDACGPLLLAVEEMLRREQVDKSIAELDRAIELLDADNADPNDMMRFRVALLRSQALFYQGDLPGLRRATEKLELSPNAEHRAFGAWYRGLSDTLGGDETSARQSWEQGLQFAVQHGFAVCEAKIRRSLGWSALRQERPDEALVNLERAIQIFRDQSSKADEALTTMMVAELHSQKGEFDKALYLIQQSEAMMRRDGDIGGLTRVTLLFAEVLRRANRVDEARAQYKEALALAKRIGHSNQYICLANLAYLALEGGDAVRAKRYLTEARTGLAKGSQRLFVFYCDTAMVAVHALAQDAERFDHAMTVVENEARAEYADSDSARSLEIAGDAWREYPEHAERCYRIALLLTPEQNEESHNRVKQKLSQAF